MILVQIDTQIAQMISHLFLSALYSDSGGNPWYIFRTTDFHRRPWPPDNAQERPPLAPGPRANASFVMLVRNSELEGAIDSISELEYRFNSRYEYPYVFLNDVPFTEEFKTYVLCSKH
jgi:hypothetical protein